MSKKSGRKHPDYYGLYFAHAQCGNCNRHTIARKLFIRIDSYWDRCECGEPLLMTPCGYAMYDHSMTHDGVLVDMNAPSVLR